MRITVVEGDITAQHVDAGPREDAVAATLEVFRSAETQVEEARLVAFGQSTYNAMAAQRGADPA